MEGISTRCSFHALFPALVGLRLAVVGVGIVATNAMILVAEVSRVETQKSSRTCRSPRRGGLPVLVGSVQGLRRSLVESVSSSDAGQMRIFASPVWPCDSRHACCSMQFGGESLDTGEACKCQMYKRAEQ